MSAVELTVGICAHNPNVPTLVRVLDAVMRQLGDVAGGAELLLVDNASVPPLAEVPELASLRLRLLSQPVPGLTAARETVVEAAHGSVILFVDDDNVLGPGYLSRVVAEFRGDAQLGLLGGAVTPEYEVSPPGWMTEFEYLLAVRRYAPGERIVTRSPPYRDSFPVGAGMAVRRALATAYVEDARSSGRIEGRRGTALTSGEDLDLGLFVIWRQYHLAVSGDLRLVHVLGASRMTPEYLGRLSASNVGTALALERKWAGRFEQPIFTVLERSRGDLLARAGAASVLGLFSPRYRFKRARLVTLARLRTRPARGRATSQSPQSPMPPQRR